MRHNIAGRKLGLPTAERMSLLANLTTSLFKHEHVETTIARGKEMRRRAEKAITCAKKGLQPGREIFYRQLAGKYVHVSFQSTQTGRRCRLKRAHGDQY